MAGSDSGLSALSSLGDPVRNRLYQVVAHSRQPVGRDEAAARAGIGRPLAAYHLDKLVELGLLTPSYQRPAGRDGPGAGRPAKVYSRSEREFAVTIPPREYELAARLLAAAVEADPGGAGKAAVRDSARQFGADLGSRGRARPASDDDPRDAMQTALRQHGFEPWQDQAGTVLLRNCPFHQLVARHRDLVCGMNLALVEGLIAGLGTLELRPALNPQPGRCCVVISADKPATKISRTGIS